MKVGEGRTGGIPGDWLREGRGSRCVGESPDGLVGVETEAETKAEVDGGV